MIYHEDSIVCLSYNCGIASRQIKTKQVLIFKEEESQLYFQLILKWKLYAGLRGAYLMEAYSIVGI